MAGVTVSLMRKTRLEYSYLANSAFTTLIVRPAIKTGRFYYIDIWVRVHEKNLASSGQTIAFELYNTYPTKEDPREFSESSPFASLTMGSGTIVPVLFKSSVVTSPGPYLKFALTISQSAAGAGTALYTQVSAGLNLREQ